MRVLHVVNSNRWTGAAAPAYCEVEALRRAGVEAHYAYVGGYRLQEKLAKVAHAHALIAKREHPVAILRSLSALSRFVAAHQIDIVHAHLTYDHALATVLAWRRPAPRVVRTFHSRRALRRDPISAWLRKRAAASCVVNSELRFDRDLVFTPPPVDHQVFKPDGPDVRDRLDLPAEAVLFGAIGKIAPHRGFEEVIRTFAAIRESRLEAWLMIIGHGAHRVALERLARSLGVHSRVIWAGYHEEDLAEYLRAIDVLLFTRQGSDEGHRAVTEALACGVPVASYPVRGVHSLLGSLADSAVAPSADPRALAAVAVAFVAKSVSLEGRCVDATAMNSYDVTAQRLTRIYEAALRGRGQ